MRLFALVLTATLVGCGTAPHLATGVTAAGSGLQARSLDSEVMLEHVQTQIDNEQFEAAAQTLKAMVGATTYTSGKDLRDLAAIAATERGLIHAAAKGMPHWSLFGYVESTEVRRTYNTLAKELNSLANSHRTDFTTDDVMVAVGEALDGAIDAFPKPEPELLPKLGWDKSPLAPYLNITAAMMLATQAQRVLRTDADVDAYQAAVDKVVLRVTQDPSYPRELLADLAGWQAGLSDLKPHPFK